jgi:hypothetical protein
MFFQRALRITCWRTTMGLTSISDLGERQLSALNAKAEALSIRDASAWEEAIDWGAPDCSTLCASEWRAMAEPDFD